MSNTNKLRFHLARGENYMKWQYRKADGKTVTYFPTENFYGVIRGKLHNNRKIANAIHAGANKNVCAWIASKSGLSAVNTPDLMPAEDNYRNGEYVCIKYDPRKFPHWHTHSGENLDNFNGLIFIFEKRLYVEVDALIYWLDTKKNR